MRNLPSYVQAGVRRYLTGALYQSELKTAVREHWEELHEFEELDEVHAQHLKDLGLPKKTPLYVQEEKFKEAGLNEHWWNWESKRRIDTPWIPEESFICDANIATSIFHSLWVAAEMYLKRGVCAMRYDTTNYTHLQQKMVRMGKLDNFQIYKTCQHYLHELHRFVHVQLRVYTALFFVGIPET